MIRRELDRWLKIGAVPSHRQVRTPGHDTAKVAEHQVLGGSSTSLRLAGRKEIPVVPWESPRRWDR